MIEQINEIIQEVRGSNIDYTDVAEAIEQYIQKRIHEQNQKDFDGELEQYVDEKVEQRIIKARISELKGLFIHKFTSGFKITQMYKDIEDRIEKLNKQLYKTELNKGINEKT